MNTKKVLDQAETIADNSNNEDIEKKGEKSFKSRFYAFLYSQKGVNTIFWIAAIGHVLMTLVFIDHEDYTNYLLYWANFLKGTNLGVYPLGFYVFFIGFYMIWDHLPKILFTCCFLIADYQLLRKLYYTDKQFANLSEKKKFWAVMYMLLSPLFALVNWGGLFDAVIGLIVLNLVFLLENLRLKVTIRNMLAIVLVAACVLIKYVGVVLIIPFLFGEIILRRSNPQVDFFNKRAKSNTISMVCFILLILAGLLFFIIRYSPDQLFNLISPFLTSAERHYPTFYDILRLNNAPFFLIAFSIIFSALAPYIFAITLCITYVLCYKKKASIDAWIILSIFDFLTFFQISHVQFILWVVFPFTLYYVRKTPEDEHLTRKYILLQAIGLFIHFHIPFFQFFYLYFTIDIFRIESKNP